MAHMDKEDDGINWTAIALLKAQNPDYFAILLADLSPQKRLEVREVLLEGAFAVHRYIVEHR